MIFQLLILSMLSLFLRNTFACDVRDTEIYCFNISSIENPPILNSRILRLTITKSNVDIVSNSVFSNYPNLQYLKITHSQTTVIMPEAFENLNNLTYLKLDYNNLKSDQLSSEGAFKSLNKLEVLGLSGNSLNHLKKSLCVGLENLKILYFENSNISVIENDAFDALPNLETLDLSGNPLIIFKEALPKRLLKLDLSNCGLDKLNFEFSIEDLRVLRLSNNNLTVLDKPIFGKSKTSIVKLDFRNNKISTILNDFFKGIENLQHLFLQDNKINKMHSDSFIDLRELRTLNLSSNIIEYLPFGIFDSLVKLTELDISNNKLTNLNQKVLYSLVNMEMFSFQYNQISHFDAQELLDHLENLKTVWLNSNSWNCEDAINIYRTFRNNNIEMRYLNSYSSVNIYGIDCRDSCNINGKNRLDVITIVCIVLLSFLASIVFLLVFVILKIKS